MQIAQHGRPQTLVLYATRDSWRYVIYTDRASLEGSLTTYVTADRAQAEAEAIAVGLFGPIRVVWDVLDPGWWVAHVDETPT